MAFAEIDEKLLVQAYQAGDDRAFDTIVRTQHQALYAHAMRRLNQHEAAEDAVQDTLLRAYRALPNLDGDLALRAWLHRILTNVCHDEGNRRNRHKGLVERVGALPEEVVADPVDEAVLHDTVRIMSEALKDLPESYREALVLRYVDGLSFREVAEATGVTEENARARVHRGRVALHKVLSRITVLLAFIIPGLRRTPPPGAPATAVTADQAASTAMGDHTFNLATQLTSHVVSSAPAISRFAELSASVPGGKSALAAAAMTAVAAISVPVAVHTAHEVTKAENRPPAVAAPSEEFTRGAGGTGLPNGKGGAGSTTTSTLPLSQTHPFEAVIGLQGLTETAPRTSDTPGSTSTSTSTTTAPAKQGPLLEGRLEGTSVDVAGAAPQWDINGQISVVVKNRTTPGTITGRVYVYEDGTAESDTLVVSLGGKTLELRYRGRVVSTVVDESGTTYQITGAYVFPGVDAFGLAERGEATIALRVGGATGMLSLDLRGRGAS
jgi:RNA polymerase sigma-70 factor (ECF subfamily)